MSGRVWVITGTNSGLGLAMALCALNHGDKVGHIEQTVLIMLTLP